MYDDNLTAAITVQTARKGRHICLIDGFRLMPLMLSSPRIYPGLYQGRLCMFYSPRGTPKPRPLHLYLHGNGSTFRNGNPLDCRAVNMVKAGEAPNDVIETPEGQHRAFTCINGEYVHLGDFSSPSEALQAVEDAGNLCREILKEVL